MLELFFFIIFIFVLRAYINGIKDGLKEKIKELELRTKILDRRLNEVISKNHVKPVAKKQEKQASDEVTKPVEKTVEKTAKKPSDRASKLADVLSTIEKVEKLEDKDIMDIGYQAPDVKTAAKKIHVESTKSPEEPIIKKDKVEQDQIEGQGEVEQTSPSLPPVPPKSPVTSPEPSWGDKFNDYISNIEWEQFTGAKLFAWLGGIALFVGAGFFVKYSIDKNLISPILRLCIGAIIGIGMIGSSFKFKRGQYDIMRQALSSGGIGVLYSVFFAATLYYEYLPKPAGFISLILVSATAFALALFHRGITVSVLGAIGAYLTPLLVNTGNGGIISLFLYLAVVNIGLYQVIKRLSSAPLLLFSIVGTSLSLIPAVFFISPLPASTSIELVWVGYVALFAFFIHLLNFDFEKNQSMHWSVNYLFLIVLGVSAAVAIMFKGNAPMAMLTGSIVSSVFLVFKFPSLTNKFIINSSLTFIVAALWVFMRFNSNATPWTFILFFLYGLSGGIGPVIVTYKHGVTPNYLSWFKVFPVAIAIIGLMSIIINPNMNFLFWPMTIGLQIVGIAISLIFGAIIQVGVLSLILLIAGLLFISNAAPITFTFGFYLFILLVGTAIIFVTFYILMKIPELTKRLKIGSEAKPVDVSKSVLAEWMSATPVMGIFFFVAATFLKSNPLNPHPGMFTIVCFLGIALLLTHRMKLKYIGIVSLFSAAFAQGFFALNPKLTSALHFSSFVWSGSLLLLALVFPFIFFKSYEQWKKQWMTWAIFELAQSFFFVFAADHLWVREVSGWIPMVLAFVKLPIVYILIKNLEGKPERNSILACHGGVLLSYLSAVPILLLETGWIGFALAAESVALLWLNRRVEHPGLRWVSSVLAPIGLFVLISSMPQMKTPDSVVILNPVVMSMLFTVVLFFYATKLAGFPDEQLGKFKIVSYFQWLAFGACFYLLNLVIADVFAGSNAVAASTLDFYPRQDLSHQTAIAIIWAFFGERTASMAVASAAGWIIYGLLMLLWRKRLDKPFRVAGLILSGLGFARALIFPFKYAMDFSKMTTFINSPTLLYIACVAVLIWLTARKQDDTWPLPISSKQFWGVFLAITSFAILNIEIASVFGDKSRAFSLLAHGNLSHQLGYSLGWLVYAIVLLFVGIKWNVVRVRQAALVLIIITCVKIFLKDLWSLGQLYRVASFVGLAFVLMLVSYLYQRFLSKTGEK